MNNWGKTLKTLDVMTRKYIYFFIYLCYYEVKMQYLKKFFDSLIVN